MPNHYTTVGLCAGEYGTDYISLTEANLCEIVSPTPDDLNGIVSGLTQGRYRNKDTGEFWTEDCNGPMGSRENWEWMPLPESEVAKLKSDHGAADWYDWRKKEWGTNSGTYGTEVHELRGDGSPVLIEFQSAWSPPNRETMAKISDYLRENYLLTDIIWAGHNPYSGTTEMVESS